MRLIHSKKPHVFFQLSEIYLINSKRKTAYGVNKAKAVSMSPVRRP